MKLKYGKYATIENPDLTPEDFEELATIGLSLQGWVSHKDAGYLCYTDPKTDHLGYVKKCQLTPNNQKLFDQLDDDTDAVIIWTGH